MYNKPQRCRQWQKHSEVDVDGATWSGSDSEEKMCNSSDTHPKLLDRFNYEFKVKTTKGYGVRVRSLACSTLGTKGCARAPRWGLGQMTSGSCWFHQHLGKGTHPPDVGEPKIELKLQGWCVNANSFSYVSNPNMQCPEAKWNHLVSCFDSHSHVFTKLLYVYHIFV
jgi:hypothetical protein